MRRTLAAPIAVPSREIPNPKSGTRTDPSARAVRREIEPGSVFRGSLPRLQVANITPDKGCGISNDALQAMLADRDDGS